MGISLVINNDSKKLESLAKNLAQMFNCEFILQEDLNSAKELIKLLPEVQLIICPTQKAGKIVAEEMATYLTREHKTIPLIILGESKGPLNIDSKTVKFTFLENTEDIELIYESVAKILNLKWEKVKAQKEKKENATEENEKNERTEKIEKSGNYQPLSLSFLQGKVHFPFDLYFLQKSAKMGTKTNAMNEPEYQIVHKADTRFDIKKIEMCLSQGTSELYVKTSDYNKVLTTESALNPKKKNPKQDFIYQDDDLDNLPNLSPEETEVPPGLKKLGISKNSFAKCNEAISHLPNRVRNTHHLNNYLQKFIKCPKSYIYKQNHLLAYLGTQVLLQMNEGDTQERIEQWVFSSFFHDLSLLNDEEVQIRTEVDLQVAPLTPREKNRVKCHAQLAVEAIDECSSVPQGTRSVILHHHGSNVGEGFPKHPHHTISPLAVLFIVLEEFVVGYIDRRGSIPDIIKNLYEKFPGEKFHNMIDAVGMVCHEHMTHK